MLIYAITIFISKDKEDKPSKSAYLYFVALVPIVIPIALISALFDSN